MDERLSFEEFSQRVSVLDREVSRRKAAEEELRAAEEWHEALAQLSPVGIFRTDATGHCLYVNQRWCEIAGISADEACGSGWVRGLHPEDRDRVASAWYEAAAADRPFHAEYRFRSPSGFDTWVLGDARAVRGPAGKLLGYIGTITDITESKAMEVDLRERVKELDCLYSLTRVLARPEPPIEEVLLEAAAALPVAWLYPEIACARVVLGEREYTTPGFRETPWCLESSIPIPGSARARVEVCYLAERPPRDEGPFLAEERRLLNEVAARLAEALERRRAQQDRALVQTLEARAEELERFGHTVSHELKTPLMAIRGFLGLLARVDPAQEPDRLERYLVRAVEASEQMAQRVSRLLELSRVGALIRLEEDVDFAAVAREAVAMVEATCVGRGIRVALAESFPRVRGDSARLREVLENLLDNALKFMGNQAEPRVQVGVRPEGSEPVFFVRDNGIGVAASDRERIFGLFTHLRPETEGAGAGLAIAKRIVEAHGGRIWVESEGPGRGAAFCFTLGPASDAKPSE